MVLSWVTMAQAQSVGDCIAIEFTSASCAKCSEMHQTTDQAIQAGWVIRRFDIHRDSHIAGRWQIQNVPTTILVRDGREIDRILGPVSYRELNDRLLASSSPDSLRAAARSDRITSSNSKPVDASPPIVRGQSPMAIVPAISAAAVAANSFARNPSDRTDRMAAIRRTDTRESTVRIRVVEAQQESVGTGTVIDTHQGEALVLTCGHLFRESQGRASITIDTFVGGQVQTYPATLIDYQAHEADIGLIAFRPTNEVPSVRLIPRSRKLVEGQSVYSVGCDRGADPTRIDSRITKLNRYLGPSNVEVDGQPVEGRSGGGLFDERGELIGVCYAADPSLREGLYNGAEVVYQQLAKLGLERLFNERPEQDIPTESKSSIGYVAEGQNPSRTSTEMTVILKDASGRQETLHIPKPSPILLQAVRESLPHR
jgi:hypothetical protein